MDNYLDQITKYFTAVPMWPFALLGVIIVIAIGVEIINRRRRADTVDYYDTTFRTELVGLYPVPTHWPEDLSAHLRTRLPVMRDAFDSLKGFIPQDQLRDYNIAWNKFYDFCRMNGVIDEKQAGTTPLSEAEQDSKQVFHQLVTDLLAYTDQFKR
ncbi:hypothetical protein [Nitrosomonas sp. Nm33]|uniref:hypothetical protein n=1 Tax=Nitrosomonas sp. Nm33 TaxID=133724 RepID=UPI0008977AE1|nr:hypothetical protein [Nitrosomonas sp. Nm33]SDY68279.1 hypothetical protein SAMN05421755_10396 [Nitrosomonas sp. Nm33]